MGEDLVRVDAGCPVYEFHWQRRIGKLDVISVEPDTDKEKQCGYWKGNKSAQNDALASLAEIATGEHALSEIMIRPLHG